ncbi:TetR family transcriptional regulator [Numidum massiliense]|uniref:TetR family transcriptional regulator n=1 Tax=Numidum massiliense TaxID=1522315 RepID=UPI0006D52E20|nr:TetR family transcriptional regulator [Numidum massiliense]
MSLHEQIRQAAYDLAEQRPFDKITFAEIAQTVGVHWTVVRRHFGSKQEMRKLLAEWQAAGGQPLADTRTRILDAAARVFAAHGYDGATLEQVAADAGLTKGAVYWHFSGKSDLFLAICDRNMAQQLQQLSSQAKDMFATAEPLQALASWLQAQLACCERREGDPMLFFEFITSSREPAIKEKLRDTYAKMFNGTDSLIAKMQEEGLLAADIDPKAVTTMLYALVNGFLLTWLIDPERVPANSLVPDVSRVLWKGLRPARE